jgi:hypothetical protein
MITHLRATTTRAITSLVAMLALAACAATSAGVKPKASLAGTAAQNPACVSQTASRISASAGTCSAFGHSFSSEDIDRTGSPTADEALRLLDPTITVHR